MYRLFQDITDEQKTNAIARLIDDSIARPSFYFLVILSVLMATYGLILSNTAVVIGSMLIAPILSPVMSLALGVTLSDVRLIKQSCVTLVKSVAFSVLVAMLATFLMWRVTGSFEFQGSYNSEILSRTHATFPYFIIAVIAGLATSFARVKPQLNEALPGTAIAVALVPPLGAIGIGLATLNFELAFGAFSLFFINAVGITAASVVMFSIMQIYTKKTVAEKSLQKSEEEQERVRRAFEEKQQRARLEEQKTVDS